MAVRVIAIDDSDIVLRRLEEILESAPDIRLVRKLPGLRDLDLERELSYADVVLVDMLMPGRSGLAALSDVVIHVPVVVVSDAAEGSEMAREAIARGARGFMSKRELATREGQERLRRMVRDVAATRESPGVASPVIALVGSTGAHRALEKLVPALAGTNARTVVLQHLPEEGDEPFVEWLNSLGVASELATSGQLLEPNKILVAPAGRHMRIEAPGRVRLSAGDGELHVPSADVLLSSATFLGSMFTAVVLSGLGRDGAIGAGNVSRAGGRIFVQAPEESVASSMPLAAMQVVRDARSLPVEALARELGRVRRR
jgi:two-component system, chemotaxis family, protein-glutamate methylesterase/glutaminase